MESNIVQQGMFRAAAPSGSGTAVAAASGPENVGTGSGPTDRTLHLAT
jgi:hypothetical protein